MSLKNLNVKNKIPNLLSNKLKNKRIYQLYRNFEQALKIDERTIESIDEKLPAGQYLIKLGKKKFIKVNIIKT